MNASKIFYVFFACVWLLANLDSARAADHGDAPGVRNQGNIDINDVYLFPSPTTTGNVVFIMTVSPVAGITGPLTFIPNTEGYYEFVVDNNADAKPDQIYRVSFSKPNKDNDQKISVTKLNGSGKSPVKLVTNAHPGFDVAVKGGGFFRADDFDDPFFFDLLSFRNGLAFCTSSAKNFFAGLNTLALVLELPASSVIADGNTKFGIWGRTFATTTRITGGLKVNSTSQFDRMGRPAINTVLVKSSNKDLFNKGNPVNDRAKFEPDAVGIIQSLGNTASGAQALGDILFPDILTLDLSAAVGFPNGRALSDDVIDGELKLITTNNSASDCVANDSAFRTTFPYLALKNP